MSDAIFDSPWQPMGLGTANMAAEEGFSWGYLDVLDDAHNGVVIIWSFGLPFLPGTVGRGRQGRPVRPAAEPSVSVAVHRAGQPDLWLLQRLRPGSNTPDPFPEGGLALDGCRFTTGPGELRVELDCPIPGGPPLRGVVTMTGVDVKLPAAGRSSHIWAPRLLGTGHASLQCGSWSFDVSGAGYHDSNSSAVGLDRLGIKRWIWGRTPHPGGTWIHYLIEPEDPALPAQNLWVDIATDGTATVERVDVGHHQERRGRWGVRCPTSLDVGPHTVHHLHAVEDGPYYQRWVTQVVDAQGHTHHGTGELVDVERMDAGATRFLTPFAVHDPRTPGWWCPLFAGPPAGRVGRLLNHWFR